MGTRVAQRDYRQFVKLAGPCEAKPKPTDFGVSIFRDFPDFSEFGYFCNMYRRFGKRFFDLALAVPGFIVVLPVIVATACIVRICLGRGVLFRQQRPGLHGKPFTLYKFRTMLDARDANGRLLPDAERLTAVGRGLRKLSLDELPQLWNVLRGDISLVGPRPLLMQYLSRYSLEQARRHEVRPGITGWAQVNGRNAISWDEKFRLDVWYVDHLSLLLDVKILVRTLWLVLRRANVSAESHATMPEFMGQVSSHAAQDSWNSTASPRPSNPSVRSLNGSASA